MPAALKITLTTEENKTLQELEVCQIAPRRTKQRATVLRLNAKGWKVKAMPSAMLRKSLTISNGQNRQ